VVDVQEVARGGGSHAIDTRHLVVALAHGRGPAADALRSVGVDPTALGTRLAEELRAEGLDPDALASVGIDLTAVSERADAVFGPGALDAPGRRRKGHVPFTRDAKKSLELALRETIRLAGKQIDSGKLLLGVLRADCPGRTALEAAGIDRAVLRAALEQPQARSA